MSTEKKYVVVKCHRLKCILKPITQQFHNLLKKIRTTNTCGNGIVFLFDIHGKGDDTTDISVGTRNERTIELMVKFNPGWSWDYKYCLLELLIKRGYSISPGAPCVDDDIKFPGGYTVKTHGGWQFEISFQYVNPNPKEKDW
jgi:hypothetical protein